MNDQVSSEPRPKAPKRRLRSAHVDNAKALLVALAVLASLLELGLYRTRTGEALYLLVYLIAVPGFAFVAGYVSKTDAYTRAGSAALGRLAGAYVGLQLLYATVQHIDTGKFSWYATAVYPQHVLWWLVSLISWRLLLPLFARAEERRSALISIGAAVVFALVAGYLLPNGAWLSLSRTLVFLPFFVTGFHAARLGWRLPRNRETLLAAAAALVVGFAALRWGNTFVTVQWVRGASTYSGLGATWWSAPLARLALLSTSALLVAAFMRVTPRFRNPLTKMGRASLSVFAWHGLVLKLLVLGGLGWLVGNGYLNVLGGLVLLLAVLGLGPVAVLTMRHFRGPRPAEDPAEEQRRSQLVEWAPTVAVLAVILSLIAKAYLTRSLVLADGRVLQALAFEGPILLLLVVAADVLFGRARRAALAVLVGLDVLLSLVMFATAVYSAYFEQVLTASVLGLAGQAAEVQDSILALLDPVHLLYIVDLPLLIGGAIYLARVLKPSDAPLRRGPDRRLAVAAALAVLIISIPVVDLWALPPEVNSVAAASKLGLLNYQLVGFRVLGEKKSNGTLTAAQKKRIREEVTSTQKVEAKRLVDFKKGAFAGKNLIIIQAEALQPIVIGTKIDGQLIAPNLTKLTEESYYFPRTYTQISRGNTSDAEWIVNTSQYPPPGQASASRWGDRTSPSLPRLLKTEGYESYTFHANEARFWNRKNMYAALGFDKYYDRAEIGWTPKWKWGSSDEVVFDYALGKMKQLDKQDQPFYVQVVTMTAHHPFEFPPTSYRPWKPTGDYAGTDVGKYLSSESYADKAIGGFVDDLKASGLWDNSIVVIYGDHFGLRKPKGDQAAADVLTKLYSNRYDNTDYVSVPLIVHVPGQEEGQRLDESVGQIDLLPSLADPLGLDLTDYPHFGRDVFVDGRALIGERGVVPEGSMINDRILFYPGLGFEDGTALDLRSGEVTRTTAQDKRDFEELTRLMQLSLEFSDGLPRRKGASADMGDAIIPNEKHIKAPLPPQNTPGSTGN